MEPLVRHDPPELPATARGYDAIDDPLELRVAVRELRRVRAWIGQFADMMAESPGYGLEGVRAAKATAGMVNLLIERAEARLRCLTSQATADILAFPMAGTSRVREHPLTRRPV